MKSNVSISELATQCGLSVHTLRYYERVGLLELVGRNSSGHRNYDGFAVEWVTLLANLRATGMPIRTMQQFAEFVRSGDGSVPDRILILEEHRASILEQIGILNHALERVDDKLATYRSGDSITPQREEQL